MAMKIPSVTSDLANAALGAKENTEIKVAKSQDKEAFAAYVLELLNNSEIATQQSDAAHQFVQQNYSWESSVKTLEELLLSSKAST